MSTTRDEQIETLAELMRRSTLTTAYAEAAPWSVTPEDVRWEYRTMAAAALDGPVAAMLAERDAEIERLRVEVADMRLDRVEAVQAIATMMPTTGFDGTLRQAVMKVCNELSSTRAALSDGAAKPQVHSKSDH